RGRHVLAGGQRACREGSAAQALLRSARRHAGEEGVAVAAALEDLAERRDADGLQLRQDVIGNRDPLDPETAVTAAGFRDVPVGQPRYRFRLSSTSRSLRPRAKISSASGSSK